MSIEKCILIVAGEPNSVFLEIYFKSIKKVMFKNPLILIGSHKLLTLQMKKFNSFICIVNNFFDVINIIGLLILFLLITLKKISKKTLFGSPATINIGL